MAWEGSPKEIIIVYICPIKTLIMKKISLLKFLPLIFTITSSWATSNLVDKMAGIEPQKLNKKYYQIFLKKEMESVWEYHIVRYDENLDKYKEEFDRISFYVYDKKKSSRVDHDVLLSNVCKIGTIDSYMKSMDFVADEWGVIDGQSGLIDKIYDLRDKFSRSKHRKELAEEKLESLKEEVENNKVSILVYIVIGIVIGIVLNKIINKKKKR